MADKGYDEKKALDPASTSAAYDAMAPVWDMIRCVLGGTRSMRAAGQRYLPQHPHETSDNYRQRLETTTLYNMTELTLDSLVGKPFAETVNVTDDSPEMAKELAKDIDLQGNNLHVFTRQWFKEGIAKAYAHVLIDMPRIVQGDRQRTLADDQMENIRPYWSLISPENVLFAMSQEVAGIYAYTHVRIFETAVSRIGYTEAVVPRIRVLEPGTWQLLEMRKVGKKITWVQIDAGSTGLNYIPMVTFHANKDGEGTLISKPPIEDLAWKNVEHWQSSSDQRNILTVARFPMLAVSGAHDAGNGDVMAIGPRQLLATRAENGKFYYVEHTGKAIESGANDLEKIEQDMASYGAEFLRKRPGAATATARALDSAEATSPLQDMTFRFKDAVEYAFWITLDWMKQTDKDVEVKIITDFGPEEVKDVDMRTLAEARRNRDLSRNQFLLEMKRRGSLREDFDVEANVKELQNEPEIASPFATGFNIDGSSASNVPNGKKKKAGTNDNPKPPANAGA